MSVFGLPELPRPLDWMSDALCAEVDPGIFHPEKGQSARVAKKVCEQCDVRLECLEWALEHDERYGVLGGLGEGERKKLRHKRGTPPPPPRPVDHGRAASKPESDLARDSCPACGSWMLKSSVPRHMRRWHGVPA